MQVASSAQRNCREDDVGAEFAILAYQSVYDLVTGSVAAHRDDGASPLFAGSTCELSGVARAFGRQDSRIREVPVDALLQSRATPTGAPCTGFRIHDEHRGLLVAGVFGLHVAPCRGGMGVGWRRV